MNKYVAKAKVSVNGKSFDAGDEITESMRESDMRFLLQGGYIADVKDAKKETKASAPDTAEGKAPTKGTKK